MNLNKLPCPFYFIIILGTSAIKHTKVINTVEIRVFMFLYHVEPAVGRHKAKVGC